MLRKKKYVGSKRKSQSQIICLSLLELSDRLKGLKKLGDGYRDKQRVDKDIQRVDKLEKGLKIGSRLSIYSNLKKLITFSFNINI